jgi:hypothetical protein
MAKKTLLSYDSRRRELDSHTAFKSLEKSIETDTSSSYERMPSTAPLQAHQAAWWALNLDTMSNCKSWERNGINLLDSEGGRGSQRTQEFGIILLRYRTSIVIGIEYY